MAKEMSNNDIAAYEGGDYGEIMDNYDLHEITAAIANRAGKAADTVRSLEQEIEEMKNNPDVVDIVTTYADLQAYDTSVLTDKDIIRVLEDSTHNDNSTYYRWNATTNQFDFVGEISGGSSVNVVQTTGTSTTDVMSQDATTKIAVGTDESYTIATSDWSALSASTPYTYQATITATASIGANSTVELINDNAVLFGTYGFAIGSVDTVNNQMTIYSVGQPSTSVTLTVNIKG